MMTNILLLIAFMKYSLLCFGGGYMIIPMLYQDYVLDTAFFSVAEFGNLVSISQITPGPVSMNTATYVGYLQNGIFGAVFATIGLAFPTVVITSIAMHFIQKWKGAFLVEGILKGARLAALSMVIYATLLFLGMSVFSTQIPYGAIIDSIMTFENKIPDDFKLNIVELVVCIGSFLLVRFNRISITKLLFASGVFGGCLGFFF